MKTTRILLIEDDPEDVLLVRQRLEEAGTSQRSYPCEVLSRIADGQARLARGGIDVLLLDLALPDSPPQETLAWVRSADLAVPVVVLTQFDDESLASHALQGGIQDYLVKGAFDAAALSRSVRYAEERKHLMAHLLQGQKLQAVGQLAAGVAHEINNPVAYLITNIRILEEYGQTLARQLQATEDALARAEPDVSASRVEVGRLRLAAKIDSILEDMGKAFADCREGTERIRSIVKRLTDFVHADEGTKGPVDLNRIVEETLRICAVDLKHRVEVLRTYGDLPAIEGRPQQIKQAVLNLLVNAAQAIQGKGSITVRTRVEGGDALLEIQDTGCGIPRDRIDRIFEPFYTTKPVGKGTGLGLHIVWQVTQAHGGTVSVVSKPGVGSTFCVRLPLRPLARAASA